MKISYHNIEKTGVTLDQLYNQEKQIRVHLTDNKYWYTLIVMGRDKEPDFMLSSFAGNYYCRSKNGMNRIKYTSLKGVQKAVKRLVGKNIDDDCIISYSISNEIDLF